MTNSPLASDRIDRPQAFFPFERPLQLQAGDTVDVALTIRHDDGLIAWTVRDPATGRRLKQSNWASTILSQGDLAERSARVPRLSPEGRAKAIVASYIDGVRTAGEIEQAVLRDHPDLFPSAPEIGRFVQHELARSTQ